MVSPFLSRRVLIFKGRILFADPPKRQPTPKLLSLLPCADEAAKQQTNVFVSRCARKSMQDFVSRCHEIPIPNMNVFHEDSMNFLQPTDFSIRARAVTILHRKVIVNSAIAIR